MMLHTKCQGFSPRGLRQEDFIMFSLIKAYEKRLTPGRANFSPWGLI